MNDPNKSIEHNVLRRIGPLLSTLCVLSLFAAFAVIAQEAGKPDPTKPDHGAAAVGSSLFRSYCGSCHGTSGVGDGPVAEFLNVKPADLTTVAARNGGKFDFATVVQVIDGREKVKGHGHGEMPVWGDAFKIASGGANEEQTRRKIEQLAHYLWTIQK
jgi:mono/diheme cytochrome c family protein